MNQQSTHLDMGQVALAPPSARVGQLNRIYYSRKHAVATFASDDFLEPGLVVILVKYRDYIVGQPVLDIGVGAGRTTLYLSQLTTDYVGIDYSAAMVAHCQGRFPGARIELCDVQDLGRFRDASFRLGVFSYNGIGAVDHGARMTALAEVRRVLRPGGVFVFSAHNRGWVHAKEGPRLARSRNPLTQAVNVVRWVSASRNHARARAAEYDGPDYSLVNDVADNYSLLHYYIRKEQQRRQLDEVGLELLEMYDRWGRLVPEGGDDRHTPWVWYVARKPA